MSSPGRGKGPVEEKEMRSGLRLGKSNEEEEMTSPLLLGMNREKAIEGYLDQEEALLARIAELENELHEYECKTEDLARGFDEVGLIEAEESLKREWKKLSEDNEELDAERKAFEEQVLRTRKCVKLYVLNNKFLKESLASLIKVKDNFFDAIRNRNCDVCSTSMNRLVEPYTAELEIAICKVGAAVEAIYRRLCQVEKRDNTRERIRMFCKVNSS